MNMYYHEYSVHQIQQAARRLGLSIRATNCLADAFNGTGIEATAEQVANYLAPMSKGELLRTPGLGPLALKEILEFRQKHATVEIYEYVMRTASAEDRAEQKQRHKRNAKITALKKRIASTKKKLQRIEAELKEISD